MIKAFGVVRIMPVVRKGIRIGVITVEPAISIPDPDIPGFGSVKGKGQVSARCIRVFRVVTVVFHMAAVIANQHAVGLIRKPHKTELVLRNGNNFAQWISLRCFDFLEVNLLGLTKKKGARARCQQQKQAEYPNPCMFSFWFHA